MKIPRNIINDLLAWKSKRGRLPLIFRGVRQVGKTSAVSFFGEQHFPDFLKVDLERDEQSVAVFRTTKKPKAILEQLQVINNKKLSKEGLLFIDEVHVCPAALTSLKYFAEELPEQAVIVAGSHLGILLAGYLEEESYSFPVGKVEFLDLTPVSFSEFIDFLGQKEALTIAHSSILEQHQSVPEAIHSLLWDLWKKYLIVGGLPQVITEFDTAANDSLNEGFSAARKKQEQLITAYEADIAKHSGKVNAQHVIRVLRAIPNKLTAAPLDGTQRFTFKDVISGIRGYERLAGPIDWLTNAGLALRLPMVKMPLSPIKGFGDEHLFKLFLFDVGLLGALSGIDPAQIFQFNFGMYKGYFAESFVLEELNVIFPHRPIVSWYSKEAEVEFIYEDATGVIPIEVKSSHKFTSRSLASFEKRFNPPRSFILSANPGSTKNTRHELPIYLTELITKITPSTTPPPKI
jgi:predicted AAA+ superfamily ATPase